MTESNTVSIKRTRKEALEHMLEKYNAKTLGAVTDETDDSGECVYSNGNGRTCVVGCLFSESVLASLVNAGFNTFRAALIVHQLGEQMISNISGMTVAELTRLQGLHDYAPTRIRNGSTKTELYAYLTDELGKFKD